MKSSLSFAGQALGLTLVVGLTGTAHAHINMLAPLVGRQGDQKADPCEGKARGPIYTFEPGALITLGVDEGIAHDGYFRIAFDDDGTDGFKNPASIAPINPQRLATADIFARPPGRADNERCLQDPADKCGTSDFCNVISKTGGPTVLWDNIDPHLGPDSKKEWKWTIQLPNVECDNCTLQVVQVMEDIAYGAHGPFDNKGDLYYRCIDIVLKKGAGTAGPGNAPGPVSANGIDCTKAEMSDAGVVMLPDSGVVVYNDAGTPPGSNPGSDAGVAPGQYDGSSPLPGTDASTPGAAGGTPGGMPPAAEEDDGCSVAMGSRGNTNAAVAFGFLALGLVVSRRLRRRG